MKSISTISKILLLRTTLFLIMAPNHSEAWKNGMLSRLANNLKHNFKVSQGGRILFSGENHVIKILLHFKNQEKSVF